MTRPPTTAPIANTVAIPKESTITLYPPLTGTTFRRRLLKPQSIIPIPPSLQPYPDNPSHNSQCPESPESPSFLSNTRSRQHRHPNQSNDSKFPINVYSYCHVDPCGISSLTPSLQFTNPTTFPHPWLPEPLAPTFFRGKVETIGFLFGLHGVSGDIRTKNSKSPFHSRIFTFSLLFQIPAASYSHIPYPCCKLAVLSQIPLLRVSFNVVGCGSVTGSGSNLKRSL